MEAIGKKLKLEGVWRTLPYRIFEGESKKNKCDSKGSRLPLKLEKFTRLCTRSV